MSREGFPWSTEGLSLPRGLPYLSGDHQSVGVTQCPKAQVLETRWGWGLALYSLSLGEPWGIWHILSSKSGEGLGLLPMTHGQWVLKEQFPRPDLPLGLCGGSSWGGICAQERCYPFFCGKPDVETCPGEGGSADSRCWVWWWSNVLLLSPGHWSAATLLWGWVLVSRHNLSTKRLIRSPATLWEGNWECEEGRSCRSHDMSLWSMHSSGVLLCPCRNTRAPCSCDCLHLLWRI